VTSWKRVTILTALSIVKIAIRNPKKWKVLGAD